MYQLHLTFLHDTWRCNYEKYFGSSNMQSPHGSRIGHVTFAWKPLIKFTSNAPTKVNLEKHTCSHTINNDLFTGRVIYLAKRIIRWWYFTCNFFSLFHNPLYYMYIFYKIDLNEFYSCIKGTLEQNKTNGFKTMSVYHWSFQYFSLLNTWSTKFSSIYLKVFLHNRHLFCAHMATIPNWCLSIESFVK